MVSPDWAAEGITTPVSPHILKTRASRFCLIFIFSKYSKHQPLDRHVQILSHSHSLTHSLSLSLSHSLSLSLTLSLTLSLSLSLTLSLTLSLSHTLSLSLSLSLS